jgi:ribosomal protein L35AE/L33A
MSIEVGMEVILKFGISPRMIVNSILDLHDNSGRVRTRLAKCIYFDNLGNFLKIEVAITSIK